jgi:hypothetical protein
MEKCSSYCSTIAEIENIGEGWHQRKLKLKPKKKSIAHDNSQQQSGIHKRDQMYKGITYLIQYHAATGEALTLIP